MQSTGKKSGLLRHSPEIEAIMKSTPLTIFRIRSYLLIGIFLAIIIYGITVQFPIIIDSTFVANSQNPNESSVLLSKKDEGKIHAGQTIFIQFKNNHIAEKKYVSALVRNVRSIADCNGRVIASAQIEITDGQIENHLLSGLRPGRPEDIGIIVGETSIGEAILANIKSPF